MSNNQTEKKSNMENPSAPLPPRPPLLRPLEMPHSYDEYGPRTLSSRVMNLAREEALKMLSAQAKKEVPKEVMDKKVTK